MLKLQGGTRVCAKHFHAIYILVGEDTEPSLCGRAVSTILGSIKSFLKAYKSGHRQSVLFFSKTAPQ